MTARFTVHGKQVLLDGEHYADACDEVAALAIALACALVSRTIEAVNDVAASPPNPSTESVGVGE